MLKVKFYETVDDGLIKFAVIIAKKNGKWIFCKHRERSTLEIPGGHREKGEAVIQTARRELYEETGALDYTITPICVYSVSSERSEETYGMLYYADIKTLEERLHSEIEKIILSDSLTDNWTYPDIQPKLISEAQNRGII